MSADAERLAAAFLGDGPPVDALDALPRTVEEGYALQDRVLAAIGRPIVGWKLAQTTPAAQAASGIDAPTVAPLLDGMIVPADTVFPARRFFKPEVEAEVVIELGRDVTGPAPTDALVSAIAGIRLAIEIADTRYVDKAAMGIAAVIGDMNSCGALVVGPLLDRDELVGAIDGPVIARLGDGSLLEALAPEMRPRPVEMLAFLAGFVSRRGHTLPAGTRITTGTHTAPTRSGPGLVAADFRSVGKVSARLSEPRA